MQQQQSGASATTTTTDPNERDRVPTVMQNPCGNTVIHQWGNQSASSSSVPMYIDSNRPAQTLYDIEQRNKSMRRPQQQASAGSFVNPCPAENPTVYPPTANPNRPSSSTSNLSHSSPPTEHPQPLPQGLPHVPVPPSEPGICGKG